MIDAHFHLWQLSRGDYDWLAAEPESLRSDFTVVDWLKARQSTGITEGILVQATPTDAETDYIVTLAGNHPDRIKAVVGWCDLATTDAAARVRRLAAFGVVVAVRPWLQSIADPDWILREDVGRGLQALQETSMAYEALVRPQHLPRLVTIADRFPQLRIIVDHGAKPDIANAAFQDWATDLAVLAQRPNVYCKLSGLLTEASAGADTDDLRPYTDLIAQLFTYRRVLWGSDWPVVTTRSSYHGWHRMARSLVPLEAHRDVFEQSARRAYGLAEGPADGSDR